jgi:hypothetical protein
MWLLFRPLERHTGTRKDTFSKCLKVGDTIDEDDQRLMKESSLIWLSTHVAVSTVEPSLATLWMIG